MDNYEQMNERINTYEAERTAQYETLISAFTTAQSELSQLIEERNAASDANNIDLFTQKNSVVMIKETTVDGLKQQLKQFKYPVISAEDYNTWRNELITFTNEQLATKYSRIKELLDVAANILDEIDQICQKHYDTYSNLEALTYQRDGILSDDFDLNGVKYNRNISHSHRKPAVLGTHLQAGGTGTIKNVLANLIELNQYI